MNLLNTNTSALLLGTSTTSFDTLLAGLGAGKMYRASGTQAPVAAQFGLLELKNPISSGRTLFGFGGDETGASGRGLSVVFDGTTISPVSVPSPMLVGGAASVATFGLASQAAPTGVSFLNVGAALAAVDYVFPGGFWFALAPNHNLQIQSNLVNVSITINIGWLELTA